jgi:hypothetical protein
LLPFGLPRGLLAKLSAVPALVGTVRFWPAVVVFPDPLRDGPATDADWLSLPLMRRSVRYLVTD